MTAENRILGGNPRMRQAPEAAGKAEFSFNPWDENFRLDPYRFYRQLLTGPPPVLKYFMPVALVARYADVVSILRDQHRFSSVPVRNRMTVLTGELFGDAPNVVSSDPPVHSRLRKLVSRDFAPRQIRELARRVREITGGLLDRIASKGGFDLMADFAVPLPVTVFAEMLGIPGEHYETFKLWSDSLIELTNLPAGSPTPGAIKENLIAMRAYFAEEIEKRRRSPGPDLMSSLVFAHDEDEKLTSAELMHFLMILLLAGSETTTNLIGNGMLALGHNPEQMKLLRYRPELLERAIEEMLRYDSPVQVLFRTAKEDLEVGGTPLEKGSGVFLIIGAANRDPARFQDPDMFDIARECNEHVSFGEGIHYCLGAPLARMQAAVAFGAMLERFPRLRIAGNPKLKYKDSFFVRGLTALNMSAV